MNTQIVLDNYIISSALKIGHDHYYSHKNCQDNLCIKLEDRYVFGVLSDGCGSCEKSEVASYLTCRIITTILNDYAGMCTSADPFFVERGKWNGSSSPQLEFSVNKFMMSGFFSDFLEDIGNSALTLDSFKNENDLLLATIIGFCLDTQSNKLLLFWCGDGFYSIDNKDVVLSSVNNTPTYPIYNYMKKNGYDSKFVLPDSLIPKGFEYKIIENFSKITIASDGFETFDNGLIQKTKLAGIEIPNKLSGLQYDKHGNFGLKKWMNMMWDRGFFADDCAIITIERKTNAN